MHVTALPTLLLAFGSIPPWTQIKTTDVQVVHRDLDEAADLLRRFTSEHGSIVVNQSRRTLRIADLPWEVDRLARLLREVDEPEVPGQKIIVANRAGFGRIRQMRVVRCADRLQDETGPIELPMPRIERPSP